MRAPFYEWLDEINNGAYTSLDVKTVIGNPNAQVGIEDFSVRYLIKKKVQRC